MTGFGRRLAGKLAMGLVMVWAVATFTFFLVRALPGNPGDVQYENYILMGMSPGQAQARVNAVYGFTSHEPLPRQYGGYLWQLAQGNLGQSTSYSGVPVAHIIGSALPWTVIPVLSGLIVSFLIGVAAGVVAAVKRSSRWGGLLSLSGSVVAGVPTFVVALLLLLVFHTEWHLLPFGGTSDYEAGWNAPYVGSVIEHAVLPVCTYALLSYGGWLLAMKSSVISVLGDDFILAAELRGITPVTRARYIGRNAILPLFTVLALSFGLMFGGSIFIENTFDYPGLGSLLLKAIGTRDYTLMSGAFLLITVAVIAANILADLCYTLIDPRVRR
ncbi:MAG: peptide ABC transporter permease [Catenulispora sp. 13_1_20CM_3_70_7]|nr:ABC transporter permease [Catenulisporales bacterium]OLE20042.1 MAG: peptide ABC transporter permease [Catenulispora sp. 13_1_20CM_3_70_7]